MVDETALNIFTDGSSYSGPRQGGTGVRFVTVDSSGNEVCEDFSFVGYKGANNNQMELQACINALKEVLKKDISCFSKIIIYTDSSYVSDHYKTARFQWSQNKWLKRTGAPVENAEQWKDLIKQIDKIYRKTGKAVFFQWIKGHSKNKHNKAVDKLAKKAAKNPGDQKIDVVKVRRKKIKKVPDGKVGIKGQRISVYIVTDKLLKTQKIHRYKYQVISKASQFFGCIDTVYSEELLSAGHSYHVKLNDNPKNPRIIKVFREIVDK